MYSKKRAELKQNNKESLLIRLGNAAPEPLRDFAALRGYSVLGRGGKEIGKVNDIYIDSVDLHPRCIQVVIHGDPVRNIFILIPITAIGSVYPGAVHLNQPSDHFLSWVRISDEMAQQRFLVSRGDWLAKAV